MNNEPLHRRIVSFARRDGRVLSRHARAWEQDHAGFRVDVPRADREVSVASDWRFDPVREFGRSAPLVVEVGSGTGEALLAAAATHPEHNFLGLEVYKPGFARTVVRAARRELSNVRVCEADAVEFLARGIAAPVIDELRVFFPDPWHKVKHKKRRLVSPAFSALAARAVPPGGVWWLATDWADYAKHMELAVDPDLWELSVKQVRTPAGHAMVQPAREGRVLTRFEKKALAAGRAITDFVYLRTDAAAPPVSLDAQEEASGG